MNEIQWVLKRDSSSGLPAVWIAMTFLPNPAKAIAAEQAIKHTLTVERVSKAWIRQHLTRRGNVVIENDFLRYPLTGTQIATIAGCLRG